MSSRVSFALAVLVLLIAAGLRFWEATTLPPGLHQEEITDIRIAEAVRQGRIEVFYDLGGEGREGLYHTLLAALTTFFGQGMLGYHILSILAGMLLLAVVYAIGIRLFNPLAAVAAVALLAVNMWAIVLSRQAAREALVPLLVASVLLTLTAALPVYSRERDANTTVFAALGTLMGMGLYIHPVGLLVALLSMVFIAYMVLSRQPLTRRTRSYINFAILLMIIIAMPYLISSLRRPDLGGAARLIGDYYGFIRTIASGLVGIVFLGDGNAAHNLPGRPLIDLVSGLLVIVGLVSALRYWRQPRFALPLIAAVVLLPGAFLVQDSPNFLAYAGLLPLLALFFGLGVSTMASSLSPRVRWIAWLGLIGLLAFNIGWTIRDMFDRWPQLPETQTAFNSRLGKLAYYLDETSATIPSIVCARNLNQPVVTPELSGAQLITLMMNRDEAPVRYADCSTGLVFINGGARQQIILPETDILDNANPYIRSWLLQGSRLTAENVPPDSVIMLDVTQTLADTIGRFTTTAPAGYAPEAPGSENLVAPPVLFGGNLAFLGYEKNGEQIYKPGDIVTAVTYWRVDGLVPPDLRLFTHILADPMDITAQHDILSIDPRQLQARDVFIQVTYVPLPVRTPDGTYFISVGAYQDTSGERLYVLDNDQPRGTRLFLYPITVTGGE